MAFFRSSSKPPSIPSFQPELRVVRYIATRMSDAERGPMIWMNPDDARVHLLTDGELVWVQGERGNQLAELVIDPDVERHTCVLRDVPGILAAEGVRVTKPDLDSRPRPRA